jgi:hypothetical protein
MTRSKVELDGVFVVVFGGFSWSNMTSFRQPRDDYDWRSASDGNSSIVQGLLSSRNQSKDWQGVESTVSEDFPTECEHVISEVHEAH